MTETKKKKFDDLITHASDMVSEKLSIIPVSPQIDMMLGGGIPEGSFVVITGPPKVGKTVTSLDFAATAVKAPTKISNKKRKVYFFNIEGRLKTRDLLGINHLNPKDFEIISSKPGNILNGEDYLEIAEQLINENPECIFIFDSFSQLCSGARRNSNMSERFRDDMPLILSNFCKRVCNIVPINKSFIIGITHIIANQSGQGIKKWLEASGQKIQYAVDVKIHAKYSSPWKTSAAEDASVIGQEVNWECSSSAIGQPFTKCSSRIRYGWGIDKHTELVYLASKLGIINKSASWYSYEDMKLQGVDKVRLYLKENPKIYDKINNELRELMGYPKSI